MTSLLFLKEVNGITYQFTSTFFFEQAKMKYIYIYIYILSQTSSPNSTRCAIETNKDTQSQSVKAKTTKQLADVQTSKMARPRTSIPKNKRDIFSF